ncbi:hypothetical protein GH714_004714 [Hevea brasiliensis]|uniref:Uncharacterized protein n=1 Tax=Hevea brasiliensis TaxID=3981 RepID=A0A6A6KAP0_HEVBR|nr:hypothetical protein GH714_004714 [Hevea brasiliensis]
MESEGQRSGSNPAAMLASLMGKREKLREELRNIEKQAEELGLGRDDGRSDFGPGRSKGGTLAANGQGKPKKGRTSMGPRDVKKIRPSNEAEFDDEDDPDMSLR